jgi:aspartate/methionine/tyrosine aminotransferase
MAHHAERFAWAPPRAGSTAFPRLLGGVPVEAFVEDLVHATGVLLLPGTLLGDAENRFRLGYGRTDLPAALERLDAYLAARPAGGRIP